MSQCYYILLRSDDWLLVVSWTLWDFFSATALVLRATGYFPLFLQHASCPVPHCLLRFPRCTTPTSLLNCVVLPKPRFPGDHPTQEWRQETLQFKNFPNLLTPAAEARGGGQEEQSHPQGVVAVWAQEGLVEPSHVEGQEGRGEVIPIIQGMEQRLCFAWAAVNRYPMPKVKETQVRW